MKFPTSPTRLLTVKSTLFFFFFKQELHSFWKDLWHAGPGVRRWDSDESQVPPSSGRVRLNPPEPPSSPSGPHPGLLCPVADVALLDRRGAGEEGRILSTRHFIYPLTLESIDPDFIRFGYEVWIWFASDLNCVSLNVVTLSPNEVFYPPEARRNKPSGKCEEFILLQHDWLLKHFKLLWYERFQKVWDTLPFVTIYFLFLILFSQSINSPTGNLFKFLTLWPCG